MLVPFVDRYDYDLDPPDTGAVWSGNVGSFVEGKVEPSRRIGFVRDPEPEPPSPDWMLL